ncbi:MAG: MYXO-CTERM sorting domain-containing protein [Myxococcota bacterium]
MVTSGLLTSMLWLAHGGIPAGTASDAFEPRHSQDLVGLEDVDFDSGWLPADSPVQFRFYAHAADSIQIEMIGDGLYDWDTETLSFEGTEMGGYFLLDVGLELQASVRFDLGPGIQWESDILGPWDYAITSDAIFTPYLLPGHPESPVIINDQTDGVPVVSVPIIPDIIVASGNLDVDVAADITAELSGTRIEVSNDSDAAVVDASLVASPLMADAEADPMMVEGVMVAQLGTAPVLIVRPHLVMSIIGQEFDIFGIDIPIPLPETDDEIVFDPEMMLFDAPEPVPGDDTGSLDESGDGGDEGVDDGMGDGTMGGADEGGTEGETDADGSSAGSIEELGGCGCNSRGSTPLSGLALLLLALGLRRRRVSPA